MRTKPSLNILPSRILRDDRSARARRICARASAVCISALEPRILLASIAGTSYADFNANGIHDTGEPALAGWTVFIDANQNLKLDTGEVSTVTNASGAYSFTNVAVGNQLIVEIPKPGWTQTGPTAPNASAPDSSVSGSAQPDSPAPAVADNAFRGFSDASFVGPPALHQVVSKSIPTDPMFAQQWNLRNTGQYGGAGNDPNFITAWNTTLGQNVRIAIVDDGVDYLHPDLSAGYDPAYSWDFDDNNADPAPVYNDQFEGDNHGTAVAGIAVARANNGIGLSGAAPGARWSAIRLVGADSAGNFAVTDAMEAGALGWQNNNIDIYNNSWGPEDDGNILLAPGALAQAAIQNAIATGRAGKGNIFVWSAGNGLANNDNVNYDGYANQRYVIAVTAIGPTGVQSSYAEPGAPILVAAYSSASQASGTSYVPSTDRSGTAGYTITGSPSGDYIPYFTGTSASAPAVSGAVALMLSVNPTLTWRDVQAILGYTARKNDASGGGWEINGAGRNVSYKYGFGALDAAAAVAMSQTWTNLAPEVSESSGTITLNQAIPDKPVGGQATPLTSSVTLDSLTHIEKVEVVFDATHTRRGDLRVVLTSPDGTQSVLAEKHNDDNADYDQWVFTSTHHWDEIAKGTWTLTVTDQSNGNTGTLNSWKLNVYGTALTNVQYVQITSKNQSVTGQDFFNKPPPSAKAAGSFIFQTTPQKITIVFDQDVASQISADDLVLHNDTLNQDLATTFAYNASTRTATFTYAPASGLAVLPDGNYTATLKASGFAQNGGLHLDGNSDNLPDDDAVFTFFQLSGDADHDRTVNLNDLIRLSNNYGTSAGLTWADGDFSGDGSVDLNDLIILANHYGSSLAAPDTASADLAAMADESDTPSIKAPLFNTNAPIERDPPPQATQT